MLTNRNQGTFNDNIYVVDCMDDKSKVPFNSFIPEITVPLIVFGISGWGTGRWAN